MLFLLFKFSCERNFYFFQFCEFLFAVFYMRLIKVEDHSIYNSERIASLICQLNRVVKMTSSLRIADASSASQANRELEARRAEISAAITDHQSKRTTSFVLFNKDNGISWRDLHKAVDVLEDENERLPRRIEDCLHMEQVLGDEIKGLEEAARPPPAQPTSTVKLREQINELTQSLRDTDEQNHMIDESRATRVHHLESENEELKQELRKACDQIRENNNSRTA